MESQSDWDEGLTLETELFTVARLRYLLSW